MASKAGAGGKRPAKATTRTAAKAATGTSAAGSPKATAKAATKATAAKAARSGAKPAAKAAAKAAAKPAAIVTFCTNFPAAHLVAPLEHETGIPIYDTVSIGIWDALHRAGIETTRGGRWGSLFAGM